MNKTISAIISLFIGFSIFANIVFAEPLQEQQILDTISSAVTWLKNDQEGNGHFHYEYIPFLDRYTDSDNMVRQTGALYILAEVIKNDTNNRYDLKKSVETSIKYFSDNSVNGNANKHKFLCIKTSNDICSLGGTSLALIGILDFVEKYPDSKSKYQKNIDGYLNFILAMQNNNHGFQENFYIRENRIDSKTESDFSNGEALLGLTRYYIYSKDKGIKATIDASFGYFNSHYSKQWDYNFYLWGMTAIKDLYKIEPQQEYYDFVKAYTDWRISTFQNQKNATDNACAYLEGIVSAYPVLESKSTEKEKQSYLYEIDFWLSKSKRLQVKKTDFISYQINNSEFQKTRLKEKKEAVGGFLTGLQEPVERIDFTQHCLSSYLQKYLEIDHSIL